MVASPIGDRRLFVVRHGAKQSAVKNGTDFLVRQDTELSSVEVTKIQIGQKIVAQRLW